MNDRGSKRVKGNLEHAKWVALTGRIDNAPTTIVVLCHPDNFRAPQAARLHPPIEAEDGGTHRRQARLAERLGTGRYGHEQEACE